jgi:hypothetical protein
VRELESESSQSVGRNQSGFDGTRRGFVYSATPTGLSIYDVGNPSQPTLIGRFTTGSPVYTIELKDNIAYLAMIAGGVALLDISRRGNPNGPRLSFHYRLVYNRDWNLRTSQIGT